MDLRNGTSVTWYVKSDVIYKLATDNDFALVAIFRWRCLKNRNLPLAALRDIFRVNYSTDKSSTGKSSKQIRFALRVSK